MQYDVETRLEVIGSSNYQKKNHRTETFDFNEKSFCIRLDVYMRNIYAEFWKKNHIFLPTFEPSWHRVVP